MEFTPLALVNWVIWSGACPRICQGVKGKIKVRALRSPRHLVGTGLRKLAKAEDDQLWELSRVARGHGYQGVPMHKLQPGIRVRWGWLLVLVCLPELYNSQLNQSHFPAMLWMQSADPPAPSLGLHTRAERMNKNEM